MKNIGEYHDLYLKANVLLLMFPKNLEIYANNIMD